MIRILPQHIKWTTAPWTPGKHAWHKGRLGVVHAQADDNKVSLSMYEATGAEMEMGLSDETIIVDKADLEPAGLYERAGVRLAFGPGSNPPPSM